MLETIVVDGVKCFVNETSSLEAFLIMHGMRRVLCDNGDDPPRHGKLAHVASMPLQPKEIDFIEQMRSMGSFPSVQEFMNQSGVIGVTDFEIVESTDLPGWDGTPNPMILSNPHWLIEDKLVPVPPDIYIDEEEPTQREPRRAHGRRRNCRRRR